MLYSLITYIYIIYMCMCVCVYTHTFAKAFKTSQCMAFGSQCPGHQYFSASDKMNGPRIFQYRIIILLVENNYTHTATFSFR